MLNKRGGWKTFLGSRPVFLILGVVIGIVGFYFLSKSSEIKVVETDYEQITDDVAKLKVGRLEAGAADAEIKENWEEHSELLGEGVTQFSEIVFGQTPVERKSDSCDYENDEYFFHEIYYDKENSPPIGYVLLKKDGAVVAKTYNHDIVVKYIVTKDKDGKYSVLAKADLILKQDKSIDVLTKQRQEWVDKSYSLNIKQGEIIVGEEKRLLSENFIIDFSPNFTLNYTMFFDKKINFHPTIGISFFQIKTMFRGPEIMFGMSSLDSYSFLFSPVSLNIGEYVPFMSNTYIKPLVGLHNKQWCYGVGLGVNF